MGPPDAAAETLAALPPWLGWALLALVALAAASAAAAAVAAWQVAARARGPAAALAELGRLAELESLLRRLVADRDDLDLRRIEHVLVDVRDGQRRLEDALLRHAEATRTALLEGRGGDRLPAVPGGTGLADRATDRLLALGYQRVQIVTRSEKLAELGTRDGEILVEARRDGTLHKGRVTIRGGRIADVEMHPAYSIFP